MTETVYYTDSTPPADYTESLTSVMSGENMSIKYALYDDQATWDAWYDWAQINAYSDTGFTNYSSRAIKIVGKWPTMQVNSNDTEAVDFVDNTTRSFMCITASAKGGVCMEAFVQTYFYTVFIISS